MNNYESSFQNTISNTFYPFDKKYQNLPNDFIIDACFLSTKKVTLQKVEINNTFMKLVFTNFGECLIDFNPGVFSFDGGYIHTGPGVAQYKNSHQVITFNATFSVSTCSIFEEVESIQSLTGDVNLVEGYNMNITAEVDTINFLPQEAAGKGVFCGQPLLFDAVYNINGILPDQNGNLAWSNINHFIFEYGYNTILYGLTIPDSRLDCTREGFKGPDGFDGPDGNDGEPGEDAVGVDVLCQTCDVSDVCCECDAVEDFISEGNIEDV